MLYRKFGKTDEKVSILGFGCMRLPVINGDEKNINEIEAIKQIRYAIDNGVNYIDTAYPYHGGRSETLVEKALRDGYREKVYLATKLPSWLIKSREDMDKYLNEQLKRLNTDYIDFYLIHALNREYWDNLKSLGVLDFLHKSIKDNKIRYAGFSFHDEVNLFKEIVDSYEWSFCQIQYNYLDENYQAGYEGLKYADKKELGIVIMEPLRGGSLVKNIPQDIEVIWNKSKIKRSAAEWAFRFLWDKPNIHVVLSGMNDIKQIKENIESAKNAYPNSLSKKELKLINQVKKIYKSKIKVNCTGCKYCMPCPSGVNIPVCFEQFNNAFMFDDMKTFRHTYNVFMDKKEKASNCINCGKCEKICPQHIAIRECLKEVVSFFEK
ncbi:aldo/keto reductase [Clostridium brassicae]|uniref:Aldo/keto reductase n=1 Tax=Clostridium brassicae TaxID=2999072 RepID=A0ABT4DEE3_9CLOT|nr:aldo/keto reductase [Clostridium brassicae]MCY6960018.1 aldo/keto reductase [Clostridium brassicae]